MNIVSADTRFKPTPPVFNVITNTLYLLSLWNTIEEKILKLQEKRKDFFSKKIEKYCLEKNLKIKKTKDNFEVVNVDYVEQLLKDNKLKLIKYNLINLFFKRIKKN